MIPIGRNLIGGTENKAINFATDLISGTKKKTPNATKTKVAGLQQFISEIAATNGLYRPNLFEVIFSGINIATADSTSMSLLCHTAELPGFKLETTTATIYSLPYEVPTGIQFDSFSCTFYVDNSFNMPSIIFNNIAASSMPMPTTQLGYVASSWSPKYRDDSAVMDIVINVFSSDINSVSVHAANSHDGLPGIASYRLKNAFIKGVDRINLDWGAHDQLASMTLEISYEWFEKIMFSDSLSPTPKTLVTPTPVPLNFDTIMAKYPALGVAYDATKRTVQQSGLMHSPILNQSTHFLP